jgi:hypothetical protein
MQEDERLEALVWKADSDRLCRGTLFGPVMEQKTAS